MKRNIIRIACSLLLLPLICGCGKKSFEVTLNRTVIETGPGSGHFAVDITTEGQWTAKASSTSGFNINWVVLNPASGKGAAKMELTVTENDGIDPRAAVVTVTSSSGHSAALKIKQEGSTGESSDKTRVRIGTFNLRISPDQDYENGNGWDTRRSMVVSAILANDFDIFGLQEITGNGNGGPVIGQNMQADLVADLGSTYEFKFFSPYSQDGVGRSSNALAFKKDKFTISNYRYFWLSETPDKMVRNDGAHNRGGTCAVFTHKNTGIRFFFMETHAPLDKDINNNLAYLYPKLEKRFNPDELPSFFVGDLNCYPASEASTVYKTWWQDSYLVLSNQGKTSGPSGTFNGFNTVMDMNKRGRIDFIYYRGNATPVWYMCDDTLYDGRYPSDHLPIYCDFILTLDE